MAMTGYLHPLDEVGYRKAGQELGYLTPGGRPGIRVEQDIAALLARCKIALVQEAGALRIAPVDAREVYRGLIGGDADGAGGVESIGRLDHYLPDFTALRVSCPGPLGGVRGLIVDLPHDRGWSRRCRVLIGFANWP